MRSDNLKTHMKQHEKRKHDEDYNQSAAKRQCNEIDDDYELEKMLEKETVIYKNKIALGEKVYKILERGKVLEVVLPKDMQNALNLYRRNVEQLDKKELEPEDEKEMNVDDEENNEENK